MPPQELNAKIATSADPDATASLATALISCRGTYPGHLRTVKAPQTRLDQITGLFFGEHVFGPGRAALLAATDADAAAERDTQTAAIKSRLKRIEIAQNSCILALEQLPRAADTTLFDELPFAGNILPGPGAQGRPVQAFDLQVLWNKPGQQATVYVEITEATLQALPGTVAPRILP